MPSNRADDSSSLSRRDVARMLGVGAVATLFGNALSFGQSAPPTTAQSVAGQGDGFYRFKLDGGDLTATLVSDGGFASQPAALFASAPKEELEAILAANFIAPGYLPASVNTLLIRDGDATILVDTGAGANMGAKAGKLIENLAKAGARPDEITHVVITHAHPDHIGGLLDASGRPQFPKARVVIGATEHAFWTGSDPAAAFKSAGSGVPEAMVGGMVAAAQGALKAVADRIDLKKGGETIGNSLKVVDAFGHTPGHIMLDVGTGAGAFRYAADLLHVLPVQLKHPEWKLLFDTDPTAAAATRKKFIDEMVASRVLISGAHLPFPAVGHLSAGPDVRWVPQPWDW